MKINFFRSSLSKEEKNLKTFIKNSFGFTPIHISYYSQAFIHRSLHLDSKDHKQKYNNERLEYLGDAILSAIVADFLYKKYPMAEEGFLTELRSRIVNRNHLNKLSQKLGLDLFIQTNDCNLVVCESIVGDAFEAFIGALYLDKGYEFTKKVIIEKIVNSHMDIEYLATANTNYKGKLLAWSQKVKQKIEYKVAEEINLSNRKQYIVQLFIEQELVAEGCDYTIKAAEQHAAMHACEVLEL